jgi:valyl-tRNA synthetase
VQDPDVLDTWFSSWLWPQAVYGWPKDTEELSYFYPTDTLVTASEIIFFWVARMIMSGLYFMEEKPFTNVYIHGTVRDDKGRKMSKSLGNAIDPLKIIDKYGADALRFSLISLPGEDLYLSLGKFEFGRNFTNKIWNASRYILTNLDKNKIKVQDLDDIEKLISGDEYLAQRWIISKLNVLIEDLEKGYENFRFDQISNKLYDFFWHKFCDWYIEIAKVNIKDEVTQAVLYIVLKNILKLLHPLIPYITEEIWQKIPDTQTQSITVSSQPKSNKKLIKEKDEQLFEHVLETIRAVRNKRSQFKISSSVVLKKILVNTDSKTISKVIDRYSEHIKKLAKIETIEFVDSIKDKPVKSTVALIKRIEIYIPLEGLIDFEKEKRRIKKQLEKTESDLKSLEKRLENKRFLKQAPDHIIKETELRKQQQILKVENLKKNLKELNQ